MISKFYTHTRKKGRPETKADPQKQKVYNMEREWIGHAIDTTMPIEKLRTITRHACRVMDVVCPKVRVYHKPKTRVFGYCTEDAIYLNAGFHGQNLSVLLHELAHWIADRIAEDSASHGPEFAGVYRKLLADYRMLPREGFDALAKQFGVEFYAIL